VLYAALFAWVAPWQLPVDAWWTWALAILGVDVLFYWAHRVAHRVRLVWATHQAHHSSEYFNFATALRQKWNNSAEIVAWLPLPLLGVPPALVFFGFSVSLVYQFFVHTERVDKLWRPLELVLNTPSHHRVHHGSDPEYLDHNYGGILIVWDRLFGSFQPELHRPTYGLTTPVGTHRIVRLQTHEYAAIVRDVRRAPSLRDKLGYVFGPPGWRSDQIPAAAGVASRVPDSTP
jgi:sterol desaturase/sphingolipid hydroxylase (fatty acid hydroxylase superfamily)